MNVIKRKISNNVLDVESQLIFKILTNMLMKSSVIPHSLLKRLIDVLFAMKI